VDPVVPETRAARAAVWAALAAAALSFALAPRGPGRIALADDTGRCRLERMRAGLEPCDCARTPLALREALGLPAPLNALSAQELERISGLGPVRAAAIVRERAARGAFGSLDELAARVPGIGAKTVDRIRPRLFVAGPDPACGGE
jgi:competence ComEA-like helix-hairpin-helix protein